MAPIESRQVSGTVGLVARSNADARTLDLPTDIRKTFGESRGRAMADVTRRPSTRELLWTMTAVPCTGGDLPWRTLWRSWRWRAPHHATTDAAQWSVWSIRHRLVWLVGPLPVEPVLHASPRLSPGVAGSSSPSPDEADLRQAAAAPAMAGHRGEHSPLTQPWPMFTRSMVGVSRDWWSYRDSNPGPLPCHGSALIN